MGGVSRQSLFSQLESSKSLLKALGLQKGPYLPLRRPVKIKLNSNLCRLKLMLTSSVVSDTDYHESLQRENAHFGQIITL